MADTHDHHDDEPDEAALALLEARGLVVRDPDGAHATRRLQAALARAALALLRAGSDSDDLRVPIALALVSLLPDESDTTIAALVAAVLPIEAAALGDLVETDDDHHGVGA